MFVADVRGVLIGLACIAVGLAIMLIGPYIIEHRSRDKDEDI